MRLHAFTPSRLHAFTPSRLHAFTSTRQVKEYVHGYRAAMSNNLYWPSKLIVWRHIWNGIAYADWDLCPEECRQAMRDNKGDSAHVWAKFLPVIKRFSTAEKVA